MDKELKEAYKKVIEDKERRELIVQESIKKLLDENNCTIQPERLTIVALDIRPESDK